MDKVRLEIVCLASSATNNLLWYIVFKPHQLVHQLECISNELKIQFNLNLHKNGLSKSSNCLLGEH